MYVYMHTNVNNIIYCKGLAACAADPEQPSPSAPKLHTCRPLAMNRACRVWKTCRFLVKNRVFLGGGALPGALGGTRGSHRGPKVDAASIFDRFGAPAGRSEGHPGTQFGCQGGTGTRRGV